MKLLSSLKRSVFFLHAPVLAGTLVLFSFFVLPKLTSAASNQFGETGLLSIATAETIGSDNLCFGLWNDSASLEGGDSSRIMPLSLTYGLTKKVELHASYPNILFNDDEDSSGRGYMNIGLKNRFVGTNRSPFKAALSLSLLKSVSDDSSKSGLTDYEGKFLFGFKRGKVKYHLSTGYRTVKEDLDPLNKLDDEIFLGAAIDTSFHRRFRTFIEAEWRSNRIEDEDDLVKVTPGVQVFITPNLTFSGGVDIYTSDTGTDWRAIVGLTTCGGIGEYIVPIPKPPKPIIALEQPKGRPPIPVLPKMVLEKRKALEAERLEEVGLITEDLTLDEEAVSPVSELEVPILAGEEEILALPVPGAPPVPPVETPEMVTEITPEGVEPAKGRVVRMFRISELVFDFDAWSLRPESKEAIGKISDEIEKGEGTYFIKIEGHTDSIGSESYNEKLSLQRASAVGEVLIEDYNIPPESIFIEGYGESKPIAENQTNEGRSKNRRVDILLIAPE